MALVGRAPLVSLMGDQVHALLGAGITVPHTQLTLTPGQQSPSLRHALDSTLLQIMYGSAGTTCRSEVHEFAQRRIAICRRASTAYAGK